MVCPLYKYASMYIDFHMLPPLSFGFCLILFWHYHLEPLLEVINDSNLGSFIYETVYNVASIINYSKEPLDAAVINSPHKAKMPTISVFVTIRGHKAQLHSGFPLLTQ